jgi:uncharacterized lipoprotein YajG
MMRTFSQVLKFSLLALLLLPIAMAGCLLNPDTVPVTYQPAAATTPIPGASRVHVFVVGEDKRADDQQTVASSKVGDTARDAVQAELQARGFVIDSGPKSTEVLVQVGRLNGHFFSSLFWSTYTADLIMHVQVVRPDKAIVYSQNFDVTETFRPSAFGSISDDLGEALSGALKKGVTQLFDDPAFIAALLQNASQPLTSPQIHGPKS